MDGSPDFKAEGLLEGLDDRARKARLGLLEELSADGVEVEDLRLAVHEDRLVLLPVQRMLSQGACLTSDEVAAACGLDVEFVLSVRRALGLSHAEADDPVFTEADADAFRALGAVRGTARLPDEGVLEVMRVVGQGLWRISEGMRTLIAESLARAGDTEREVAGRYVDVVEELRPVAGPFLESAMRAHLREGLRTEELTPREIDSGEVDDTWTVTVCFVDLVGFTGLGERLPTSEVVSVAGRLATLAARVARPPVRLIKTIGDAAMLVSTEAAPMLEAAAELVSAAEDWLPPLRAGIAHGPAYTRGGDWYGATVNLASRVAGVAEPGSVLATEDVRHAAGTSYSWESAGRGALKGVRSPPELFVLAR